ncbi:methionyl-tRNA formyltransferase [Pararhizobium sp. PWRC1-1]|uniref:methionyl-tRNA formyltransferase n=1 Tax=Pararhizobium sp. PWRC1-1 TaxID=2804566 RepID=UPI003CF833DC
MRSERTVLLVGLGSTTATAFRALEERFTVLALVRPGEDDVVQMARAAGVRVVSDPSIAMLSAVIEELRPDAVVVSSYNRVLPAHLLQSRPFINVHYAPLPRYRGRATVNWAILNGETEAAISIHCLTEKLDAGGILMQRFVPIRSRDTVTDLYQRLNALQRKLLAGAVERRLSGDLGDRQNEAEASYCCGRVPSDGMIDWSTSTMMIDRLIRSLGGEFPSAFSHLGIQKIEILRAEPVPDQLSYVGHIPGRVVDVDRRTGYVEILTGDGILRLQEIRLSGAAPCAAATAITSTRMSLGINVADLAMLLDEGRRGIASADEQVQDHRSDNKTTPLAARFSYQKVRQSS